MRVRLALGSVADLPVDAAVRIAPPALVARSLDDMLARAGPEVETLCRTMRRDVYPHGLPAGEAIVTPGGQLSAAWLIHVVVPTYSVKYDRAYQLSAAYRACLREADSMGARTVAMPALGAWDPFWPLRESTRIAIGTLEGSITRVTEVHLVLSNTTALEVFAEALARR
jgi:O-acetyl-ADP-ribose deacetylase (regulator of RNase III)